MSGIAPAAPRRAGIDEGWSASLLRAVERSHATASAWLVALCLLCFLPGFVSLQPMDRDEPRFAQATKQMIETGDFVDIRFQDEARYKKPIGIHWLQAASVEAAGALGVERATATIAVYRLPSLLGAIAAVLLTYWAALAFGGRREAFLAACLMAASVILSVEARLAKTDAVLLACTVAAMGGLARAWLGRAAERQPAATVATFWIGIAAGILVKGPIILLFVGLATAVLALRERSLGWVRALRPGLGIVLVLLAVLPWFGAIAWKSGGEFYRLAVGDDMLGKVTTGQQQHGGPPGFYLVAFFATFWPGAILAAIAAPFVWGARREDWALFVLAWVLPAWLVFEAVPTKLPHYVMPLYPAVAIGTVLAIARGYVGPWRPGARAAFLALPLIPGGLAAGLSWAAWTLDGTLPAAGLPLLLAAAAAAIGAWVLFGRGRVVPAAFAGIVSSILLAAGVFGLTQPVLQSLKLSPRLAAATALAPCAGPAVATLGYREPSLVFLVGTGLTMVEHPEDAAAFLARPGCRVAIVDSRFELRFLGFAPGREPVTRVRGFNINGGRRVDIAVYAAAN